jgi:hypothetical protein
MPHINQHQPQVFKDASFQQSETGANFKMHQFTDFSGVDKEFIKCDFSYSTFTRVYFKKVNFIQCNFTGAKFFDSNLRDATFQNCKFHYASFKFTMIDSKQVLSNLPDWANVKSNLLQLHKANANSLGDIKASRAYLLAEIAASKEHLRKAIDKSDGYYSLKYKSWQSQLQVRWKYFLLSMDDFIWGHGESPWRIIRNVIAYFLLLSIIQTIFKDDSGGRTFADNFRILFEYFKLDIKTFLGVPNTKLESDFIIGSLILLRYVTLGLFIRILFNKYSWR